APRTSNCEPGAPERLMAPSFHLWGVPPKVRRLRDGCGRREELAADDGDRVRGARRWDVDPHHGCSAGREGVALRDTAGESELRGIQRERGTDLEGEGLRRRDLRDDERSPVRCPQDAHFTLGGCERQAVGACPGG